MIQHPAQKPSDSQSGNHFGGDPADQGCGFCRQTCTLVELLLSFLFVFGSIDPLSQLVQRLA